MTPEERREANKIKINEIHLNDYRARLITNVFDQALDITECRNEGTPIENKKVMLTEEFIRGINEKYEIVDDFSKSPLLPLNCRYYKNLTDQFILYVIEQQPEIRTISINVDLSNLIAILKSNGQWEMFGYKGMDEEDQPYYRKPYTFNLAFPFVVYFIVMERNRGSLAYASVFFRNMPIRGFGDILCKAPLYNIPGDQGMCLGMGAPAINGDPMLAVEKIISHFWNTNFNEDFMDNVLAYEDIPIVNNYFSWQYYSKTDPMRIFQVEWKKYKTLKQVMDKITNDYRGSRSYRSRGIQSVAHLIDIFNQTREVSRSNTDNQESDELEGEILLDNIASYIQLEQGLNLYIEDSFKIKNNRYFVLSFLTRDEDLYYPEYVKVMREKDNKILMFALNQRFKDQIQKSVEEEQLVLSATVGGFTISKGDVIHIQLPGGLERHRRVDHIRTNIEGDYEARLGDDYYILKNIRIIDVIDLGIPKLYGKEINKDKEYVIVDARRSRIDGQTTTFNLVRYDETTITSSGFIKHEFIVTEGPHEGASYSIGPEAPDAINGLKQVYSKDELRQLPYIHRVGSMVKQLTFGGEPSNSYLIEGNLKLEQYGVDRSVPDLDEIIEIVMFNDKQTFFLEGIDGDLCFSVGDKVIVPDWQNPLEMLKIKRIAGFEVTTEEQTAILNAVVETKTGEVSRVPLVVVSERYTRRANINISAMYRIINKYKDLKSGTKISAKEARISNFPMKDTNIIIGFLTDMGLNEPLVLCSNGCTLWYNDIIEKFDIIPYGTDEWKKRDHAPFDISKIRPQPGDFWAPRDSKLAPFVISYDMFGGNGLRHTSYSGIQTGHQYPEETFDKYRREHSIPYGILGPRYTQSQLLEMEKVKGFATPFGIIIYNERSDKRFPVDPGRTQGYVQRIPQ